jgi:general secretion pathway protein A
MYLDYWGLKKHAFHNVPDPSMYFEMHETVENTVAEILFAIEEGDECLAVVVGEVGLGKTMTLRVVLDSLEPEKYNIAFITNPDLTFPQLLREIVGQLTGQPCTIRSKEGLLEEFNRILFASSDAGKKVLVFIDEGNAIRRMNLESLRLLTNMQDDDRNLFTLILAGQPELARKLEHPSMANLFQRIGVYCKLEKLRSRDLLKDYIEHRLERAGANRQIFSEDAYDTIWDYSEQGIPRLVNRLCKLALKAGETNQLELITADVIRKVGDRFVRKTGPRRKAPTEAPRRPEAEPEVVAASVPVPEAKPHPRLGVERTAATSVTTPSDRKLGLESRLRSTEQPHRVIVEEEEEDDAASVKQVLERMRERHRRLGTMSPFFR